VRRCIGMVLVDVHVVLLELRGGRSEVAEALIDAVSFCG
jgi:hypothetical protein